MKAIYIIGIFLFIILLSHLFSRENYRISNVVVEYLASKEVEGQENVPNISSSAEPDILIIRIERDGTVTKLNKLSTKRVDTVIKYIKKTLKKYPDYNIHGIFCIGMEDYYNDPPAGVMVFSKKKGSRGVLIPDLYAMENYHGDLREKDKISFEEKKDKGLFIGTSTGSIFPPDNERLRACRVAKMYPNHFDSYLTEILQMKEENVVKYYPDYKSYLHPPMSKKEQYQYRYLINIDGNTCAWNRLPWLMNSKSVCIRVMSNNLCWYYPILDKITPYVVCNTPEDLPEAIEVARKMDKDQRKDMQKAARKFVKDYLNEDTQMYYFALILKAKSNDSK